MNDDKRYEIIDDIVVSLQNKQEQEEYMLRAQDDCSLIVRNNDVYLEYQGQEYLTNNSLATIELYLEKSTIKKV